MHLYQDRALILVIYYHILNILKMKRFFRFRFDQYPFSSKINNFLRVELNLKLRNQSYLYCYYKDLFLIFEDNINYESNE